MHIPKILTDPVLKSKPIRKVKILVNFSSQYVFALRFGYFFPYLAIWTRSAQKIQNRVGDRQSESGYCGILAQKVSVRLHACSFINFNEN